MMTEHDGLNNWEAIEKAFNTNEIEVEETVARLRKWMKEQPHLPDDADDTLLRNFALGIGKGFDDCTKRLDIYFSYRGISAFFKSRDPTQQCYLTLTQSMGNGFMPGYTPERYKVAILKLLDNDPAKFFFNEGFSWLFMLHDVLTKNEICTGYCCLIDCGGFSFKHYIKLSPTAVREAIFYVQNIFPLKIKKMIFINVPSYMKIFLELVVFPLLNKKLTSRVHQFTDCPKQLHELLPVNLIPSDMGGTGISIRELTDLWEGKLQAERNWLMTDGNKSSDETKRTGKSPLSRGCAIM